MAQGSIGQQRKSKLYSINTVAELPLRVPHNTDPLQIDINILNEDADLSNWLPKGLPDGAEVSVRKLDTSTNRIIFTDSQGVSYNFVGKRGEVMAFIYNKKANELRVK